jgi:hypothetical protein
MGRRVSALSLPAVARHSHGHRYRVGRLGSGTTRCCADALKQALYLAYPNNRATMSELYYTTAYKDLASDSMPLEVRLRKF